MKRCKTSANSILTRELSAIGSLSTSTSIDTIEVFFQKPPRGLRTDLEAAHGKRIRIEKCLDATGYQRGVRAIINRTSRPTLKLVSQLLKANKLATLSRLDIATDFKTPSEEAALMFFKLLDRHLVLKWRSPTTKKSRYETTVYWTAGRSTRNLAVYKKADRTIRLELRFFGSRAVRRAGFEDPISLLELNPRKTFEHNVALVSLRDRYITKAVRKAVAADREQHLKNRSEERKRPRAQLFIDQYRSRISIRAERQVRRIDIQELRSSTRRNNTQNIPLGNSLQIPECLTWPE